MTTGDGSAAALAQLKMERDTLKSQIDFMFQDAFDHPRYTARNWARKFKAENDHIYKGKEVDPKLKGVG